MSSNNYTGENNATRITYTKLRAGLRRSTVSIRDVAAMSTLSIKAECSCGRKLSALPFNQAATTMHWRTCQRCKQRWRIMCAPQQIKGGWIHTLTLWPMYYDIDKGIKY